MLRDSFLPFSKPSISQVDIDGLTEVLRSGWLTTGPKAAKLEEEFSKYIGSTSAVALSSATAGMHTAMVALGIGPGDEVITPSMTWVSTVNMIVLAGATPVFADIDKDTMMISRETIEPCITDRTKLVVPVHFAGAPVDMDPIYDLCQQRGLSLIEDAAHSVGTFYKDRHIGEKGTAIFSFHPIKNMTTGEGGIFSSDDEALLERVRRLKFHGLGVDAYDRKTQGRSPQAEVLEPGFKYNMPDIAASLGLTQLAQIDEFNKRRSQIASVYREAFHEIEGIAPLALPSYEHKHANHLFIVRILENPAGLDRDGFMQKLKEKNIGTGLHFRAVHLQKYYLESMGSWQGKLPNTEWNSERICSLPLFPDMSSQDVNDVIDAVKEVLS